jgi:hypothetical protein
MSRYLFLHRMHPVDAPLPTVGQLSSGRGVKLHARRSRTRARLKVVPQHIVRLPYFLILTRLLGSDSLPFGRLDSS